MNIIELKSEHLNKVSDLHVRVCSEEPWNEHWEPKWAVDRYQFILNSAQSFGFVAIEGSEIVGVLAGRGIPFKGQMEFDICELLVDSKFQNNGIGKALISHTETTLNDAGISAVTLLTSKGSVAEHFYTKCGYDSVESLLFMCKDISAKNV